MDKFLGTSDDGERAFDTYHIYIALERSQQAVILEALSELSPKRKQLIYSMLQDMLAD